MTTKKLGKQTDQKLGEMVKKALSHRPKSKVKPKKISEKTSA